MLVQESLKVTIQGKQAYCDKLDTFEHVYTLIEPKQILLRISSIETKQRH